VVADSKYSGAITGVHLANSVWSCSLAPAGQSDLGPASTGVDLSIKLEGKTHILGSKMW